MRRMFMNILALAVLAAGMIPAARVAAQSDIRCFPATGYCISGPIRRYWESNGGLATFGYPTSPVQTMTIENWTGPAQWFERDRLEDHSAQGIGVLAGRLGAERLEQLGRPWTPRAPAPQEPGCRLFTETGYQVCGLFRTYWERNGGLERFGYPITDYQQEIVDGRPFMVQYFERRRMEFHPNNPAPYTVLLGLLGNEVRSNQRPAPACSVPVLRELEGNYREFAVNYQIGCPLPGQEYVNSEAAAARFERGQMYWVNLRGGRSLVYVISYQPDGRLQVREFVDQWREGDPVDSGLTAPEGLYEPRRGFGKIWRENPDVRAALGWALENERAERVTFQVFANGELMQVFSEGRTWLFMNDGPAAVANTKW